MRPIPALSEQPLFVRCTFWHLQRAAPGPPAATPDLPFRRAARISFQQRFHLSKNIKQKSL
jgi:hypothetical protein